MQFTDFNIQLNRFSALFCCFDSYTSSRFRCTIIRTTINYHSRFYWPVLLN